VRRLAVADDTRDVAHRDRRLLDQQLRGGPHAAHQQVLAKRGLPELGIGARQLPRRAGERPRDALERERAAVVARDRYARKQIQATAFLERRLAHALLSDERAHPGHGAGGSEAAAQPR
jgi:hypothetical protein